MFNVRVNPPFYYHLILLICYLITYASTQSLTKLNPSLSEYFSIYIDRFFVLLLFAPATLGLSDRISLLYLLIHSLVLSLLIASYNVRFLLLTPLSYFTSSFISTNEQSDIYYIVISAIVFISSLFV